MDIVIAEEVEETKHRIMGYGTVEKYIFRTLLVSILLIGSGIRLLILGAIRSQGGMDKPINRMIGVDEFVKMVGYSVWILFVLMAAELEMPIVHYTGEPFCHVVQYLVTYGVFYGYLGGAGIALMRMLYIQFPRCIQSREMTVAMLITSATLVLGRHFFALIEHNIHGL